MASKYESYRKALGLSPSSKGSKYQQYRTALGLDRPEVETNIKNINPKPSKYDTHRMNLGMIPDTRPIEQRPRSTEQVVSEAPKYLTSFGTDRITGSTLFQATQGNRNAQNRYKAATGVDIKPLQGPAAPSQHQLNENAINSLARENGFANFVAPFSRLMNDVTYGNPVGQFVTRSVGTGGGMLLGTPSQAPATTGNRSADKVADVLGVAGGIVGAGFNPSGGGNLITAPLRGVSGALNTRAGQALTNGVSRTTRLSQPVARAGIEGAATGAIGGVAAGLVQGQDSNKEILLNAGLGAGLGAVGDIAARGIGNAINRRAAARTTPDITARPGSAASQTVEPLQDNRTATQAATATPEAETMQGNWFTDFFGNIGVGISPTGSSKSIRKGALSTEDQIVGSPIRNDAEGLLSQSMAAGRSAYQNFFDYLAPLKTISPKAYVQAIDASRANNIANTLVRDKFVDLQGNVLGPGLEEITKKVARGQSRKFKDYIVLKNAESRMNDNQKVYADELNMTTDKVRKKIEDYEIRYPQFRDISNELYNYQRGMLQEFGVKEGLITPELYDVLTESRPYYVPMRRQFSLSEKFARPAFSNSNAFSGQKAPIKHVSPEGSVRDIVDPYRSIVESTGAWIQAAFRNRVMRTLVDAVKMDPEALKGIIEIVQPLKGQKNLNEILSDSDQIDLLEELSRDFEQLFKRTKLSEDNIVRAMVNGEPVYVKVHDPEAVKALVGLGPEATNAVMKVMQSLSDATKFAATGVLAPMFSVKSVIPDTIQAMINSDNSLVHLKNFGFALVSSIADTLPANSPLVGRARALSQDFRRSGGEYSAALRSERKLRKGVRSLSRDPYLSPQGVAKGIGNVAAAPFRALNKVADVTENLNRMAAFKTELDRFGGDRAPDTIRKAINQGREVTTNFSRRGSQSQSIEAFAPYSNAAMQSLYRVGKQIMDAPLKTALTATSLVLLPKAYEYMMFADDEDYKKLPAREKFRNLFVGKNDDGKFIKVPMPQEYNALGALGTAAVDYFFNDNNRAFKGAADALANAYTPPLVTGALQGITQGSGPEGSLTGILNGSVFGPPTAVISNIDYAGRPIESATLDGNSPSKRFDERTSRLAIQLGDKINMSPKKIDYILRQYGGDLARILLPLTSDQGAGNISDTLMKNFITDPEFTNTLSDDFYSAKEDVEHAFKDFNDGKAELPRWATDRVKEIIVTTKKGSYNNQLKLLRDEKKELNNNKNMPAKTKADRQRELQRQMNEIYIDVIQQLEEAGVPLR